MLFTGEMSFREAWNLIVELLKDPSSRLFASVAKWEYPMSRTDFILADLHDRFTQVHFKKPQPYPRPFKDIDIERSAKPTVDQSEIRAALAARGHGRN